MYPAATATVRGLTVSTYCSGGKWGDYIGVVARAKGMSQIANETGLSREQRYRSFSEKGNPTLKTTLVGM